MLFCISCELIQIRSDTRQPLNSASSALVPEPNNPHDRNAVAVISNGVKVGYIPRRIARTLQPVLLEPRGISWTINLNVLRSDLPDSNDEADDGCAAIVEITASATDDCDALPLLRIQAETVVAAAGSKRLSSSELHSKFIRDSLQLLSQVHAHSDHTVVSPSHAQLIGTVLAQDDAALALLSRLLQRRALWVQASALKLHPTSAALSSLVAIGVVATTAQPMSPQLALSLLPSLNLPLLTKLSRAINAKQAATKGDVLREIHNAAFKQRTLFGGAIDLASAITRCLIDQSPFICVLPSVRRLCGRAATFTFLGVAAPAAVTAAVASEFDEGLHDGTLEGATSRYPLTHSHSGCLPWFKLLPMIDVCKVDRPCDLLMAARPTMPPPSTIICVLSDFEMSDCDFAKDCLSAALWIGGKPSVSHSAHNWTSSALAILMSCAVRGIRNYLHRHACIAQHSAVAQLLSCVLELIPPTPLNFPNALTMSSDTEVFPSLPRALAAAATASAVATRPSHCVGAVPLEAASAAVHALVATSASDQSASSPMQLLQALPHMQPHYVSRFSSINIYCKTLHYLSSLLETEGMHAHACIAYVILLLLPYIRHRRAHWWTRLCINVENPRFPSMVHSVSSCGEQYSDPNYISLLRMCCCPSSTSSLLCHSLLLCALSDDMIDEDNIYCLVQRAQRLAEGSSASESCKLSISTAISSLNVAALKIASEVIIEGRPSNRTAGKKSHFIGFDDSVCVSVEDLALQWYSLFSFILTSEHNTKFILKVCYGRKWQVARSALRRSDDVHHLCFAHV